MFAFLIQNSIMIQEIIRREYDFAFTSLEALSPYISRISLLGEFAENTEYYKTAYYLGCGLYGNDRAASARGIWTFLATNAPAGEWRNRALSQLRQPQVERVVEMP